MGIIRCMLCFILSSARAQFGCGIIGVVEVKLLV
jgi:hypothetical protein